MHKGWYVVSAIAGFGLTVYLYEHFITPHRHRGRHHAFLARNTLPCNSCGGGGGPKFINSWQDQKEVHDFQVMPWNRSYGDVGALG